MRKEGDEYGWKDDDKVKKFIKIWRENPGKLIKLLREDPHERFIACLWLNVAIQFLTLLVLISFLLVQLSK